MKIWKLLLLIDLTKIKRDLVCHVLVNTICTTN
jgi:hypothetical protein